MAEKKRILVVDDSPTTRNVLRNVFAAAGYAAVAIDFPLHGVSPDDPLLAPLYVGNGPFAGVANERTFDVDYVNNQTGAPGPDGIIDPSGAHIINLPSAPTTRDNLRDMIHLARAAGQLVGAPNAGQDMTFDFPTLIAHCARSRSLMAGTVIGSGTVANQGSPDGSCCLAEVRCLETIADGKPSTPFMSFGDRVEIEMLDASGTTIFGAIDQRIKQYHPPE